MRLVFVHGMRQEGKDPDKLRTAWIKALEAAWRRLGLPVPEFDLDMPFYGDELERLVAELRGGGNVLTRGGEAQPMSETEQALIDEYRKALNIASDDVDSVVAREIVAKGPLNSEWVQGAARLLEKIPGFGSVGLNFVSQVDGYLERPHIAETVDKIVSPALTKSKCLVVAHSLGTVISYKLLRAAGTKASVPLFLTLGSPLGIGIVRDRLGRRNLSYPDGVECWANGTDQRDYVALHARLAVKPDPPTIYNHTEIHNGKDDAHLITDYLADDRVARAIHGALLGTVPPLGW